MTVRYGIDIPDDLSVLDRSLKLAKNLQIALDELPQSEHSRVLAYLDRHSARHFNKGWEWRQLREWLETMVDIGVIRIIPVTQVIDKMDEMEDES